MPKCEFTFPPPQDIEEQKKKLTAELEKINGSVEFKDAKAEFSVKFGSMISIAGSIHFREDDILVQIDEKPGFISCEMIGSEIKKFFIEM